MKRVDRKMVLILFPVLQKLIAAFRRRMIDLRPDADRFIGKRRRFFDGNDPFQKLRIGLSVSKRKVLHCTQGVDSIKRLIRKCPFSQ